MTVENKPGQKTIKKEVLKPYLKKTLFIIAALAIGPALAVSTLAAIDFASVQRVGIKNKVQRFTNNILNPKKQL